MKTNQIKPKVSVIVINYNNQKYLNRCLYSLKKQTYKNFEIIFVDDDSADNSVEIAKNFFKQNNIKEYKIKINNKKTKFGSFNQINCILNGLKECKSEIIFFLDSDDFFKNSKIEKIVKHFKKNKKLQITFDLSYKFFNKKKKYKFKIKKRSKNFIPWPSFPSQSCLVVKKNYLKKIIKNIVIKKYPNLWFDFRLITKAFYDFGDIKYIDEYLTFYQQHLTSESIKFKKFTKNWWKRRKEAHDFVNNEIFKNKKNFSADYFFTNLVNIFI